MGVLWYQMTHDWQCRFPVSEGPPIPALTPKPFLPWDAKLQRLERKPSLPCQLSGQVPGIWGAPVSCLESFTKMHTPVPLRFGGHGAPRVFHKFPSKLLTSEKPVAIRLSLNHLSVRLRPLHPQSLSTLTSQTPSSS